MFFILLPELEDPALLRDLPPRPDAADVARAQHDPLYRQRLLAAQLRRLSYELDQARTTTAAGVARIELMRAQAKLATDLTTLLCRIQEHLTAHEPLDDAA